MFFGLSWEQIFIIVLVGVFLLGPERIPVAIQWVVTSLRKVRTLAAGAQAQLRSEIGPELDELRRQIAELQSLKEIQELRDLRDLHPRRIIGRNILGDEFAGGISGFMKSPDPVPSTPSPVATPAEAAPAESVPTDSAPTDSAPAESAPVDAGPSITQLSKDLAALHERSAAPATPPAEAPVPVPAFGTPAQPPFDPDAT